MKSLLIMQMLSLGVNVVSPTIQQVEKTEQQKFKEVIFKISNEKTKNYETYLSIIQNSNMNSKNKILLTNMVVEIYGVITPYYSPHNPGNNNNSNNNNSSSNKNHDWVKQSPHYVKITDSLKNHKEHTPGWIHDVWPLFKEGFITFKELMEAIG